MEGRLDCGDGEVTVVASVGGGVDGSVEDGCWCLGGGDSAEEGVEEGDCGWGNVACSEDGGVGQEDVAVVVVE